MNGSMIRYILGCVLKIEAALLLLPVIVAAIYGERQGLVYLAVAVLCAVLGFLMSFKRPKSTVFYLKEGCFATAASWLVLSAFGALPFVITKEIPFYVDALFETVSGFTTTGASIMTSLGEMSRCSLFWRSFTHWIGGMGVLVFLLAIVPLNGGSHINLMRAESPGPSVGKLVPKIRQTALLLYVIYFGMTVLEFILLICGNNLNVFESMLISFGTAGTGGFWINNTPMGEYCSPYTQWVIASFMILFGVNFNAYYYLLFRKFKKAFGMEEVRCFLLIVLAAVTVITVNIVRTAQYMGQSSKAIRDAVFQVGSVISSTGFSTTDFDTWPALSKTVMVLAMFCGACAGSTGGGIKVSRIMIAIKSVFKELHSYIHPKSVRKIKIEGKPVEHEVVRSVNVYLITFAILYIFSLLIISIEGKDLVTNFTAVIATINNIGPGLAKVGPYANFAHFSPLSKLVLTFNMLAGRLELFPMLILFHPAAWREMFRRKTKKA